jgi:hypothetical protein
MLHPILYDRIFSYMWTVDFFNKPLFLYFTKCFLLFYKCNYVLKLAGDLC